MVDKDSGSIGGKVVASVLVTVVILAGGTFLFHRYIIPVWELDAPLLYALSLRLFPILIGVVLFLLGAVVAATHPRVDQGDEDDFLGSDPYVEPLYRLPDGQREEVLPKVSMLFDTVATPTPSVEFEDTTWPEKSTPNVSKEQVEKTSWAEFVQQERGSVPASVVEIPTVTPPVAQERDSEATAEPSPLTAAELAAKTVSEIEGESISVATPVKKSPALSRVEGVSWADTIATQERSQEASPVSSVELTATAETSPVEVAESLFVESPALSRAEGISWAKTVATEKVPQEASPAPVAELTATDETVVEVETEGLPVSESVESRSVSVSWADSPVVTVEDNDSKPWGLLIGASKTFIGPAAPAVVPEPTVEQPVRPVVAATEQSIPSRLPTIVDSLVPRLDAEVASARLFDYDLSLVTFNRDEESAVIQAMEAELNEVAFLYSDEETVTSILPFYSFNRTKRLLARSLDSARKKQTASRFALGFSSLSGRDVSADELLKESHMALNLADDQGGLSLIGFEAESTTLR